MELNQCGITCIFFKFGGFKLEFFIQCLPKLAFIALICKGILLLNNQDIVYKAKIFF